MQVVLLPVSQGSGPRVIHRRWGAAQAMQNAGKASPALQQALLRWRMRAGRRPRLRPVAALASAVTAAWLQTSPCSLLIVIWPSCKGSRHRLTAFPTSVRMTDMPMLLTLKRAFSAV